MGFEVPQNTLRLVFTDPSYSGLEVTCRVASLDEMRTAAALDQVDPHNVRPEDLDAVNKLLDAFAGALVEWNLTAGKRKVPATRKGVGSLSLTFAMQLVGAWLEAHGELITRLAEANGVEEADLPVEPMA